MAWLWFAATDAGAMDEAPGDDERLVARVTARTSRPPSGGRVVLRAWRPGSRPVPEAVRIDADEIDPQGEAAAVSLVLIPTGRQPLFDDPAVSGALRRVLDDPTTEVTSTFSSDSTHFAGALTARRRDPARLIDDPFARLHPAELLDVPAAFVAAARPPSGPVTQRYAGQPWPATGFTD